MQDPRGKERRTCAHLDLVQLAIDVQAHALLGAEGG